MLTRWHPFNPFLEVESLFKGIDETLFGRPLSWRPTVDAKEENDMIIIDAELPGMTEENVKVSIEENVLTISGERKIEREGENKYYTKERYYGSFARSFPLPSSAEIDKIDASFDMGVLTIKVPNKASKAPRKIEVRTKRGS